MQAPRPWCPWCAPRPSRWSSPWIPHPRPANHSGTDWRAFGLPAPGPGHPGGRDPQG
jgi:hypothetical protein